MRAFLISLGATLLLAVVALIAFGSIKAPIGQRVFDISIAPGNAVQPNGALVHFANFSPDGTTVATGKRYRLGPVCVAISKVSRTPSIQANGLY
jgi:hypothetical protein